MKRLTVVITIAGTVLAGAAWLLIRTPVTQDDRSEAPHDRSTPLVHIEPEAPAAPGAAAEPHDPKLPMAAQRILDPSKRVRPPPGFVLGQRSRESRLLGGDVVRQSTPASEQPTEGMWNAETYTDPEWFPEGDVAE